MKLPLELVIVANVVTISCGIGWLSRLEIRVRALQRALAAIARGREEPAE